ncbi:hypothetical protein D7V86_09485 [bacterium D16-51]|nr:hypothetical protein D7V96_20755 [bacterium D16-59]RKI60250.1 hypothetical protein D7V86_09485 [bacterium D16-51]
MFFTYTACFFTKFLVNCHCLFLFCHIYGFFAWLPLLFKIAAINWITSGSISNLLKMVYNIYAYS